MLVEGLVSTIIPVHNRPSLVREAVASVIAQTYRPIEIVIVDDGSTDETGREVARLADQHPEVRAMFRRENGGPGAARESGRQLLRGVSSFNISIAMTCFYQQSLPFRSRVYGKTRIATCPTE